MKLVILESPYSAADEEGIAANVKYAQRCVRDSLLRDEAPIASHLLYTQPGILKDSIPAERERGMEAGLEWASVAQCMVVYDDRGFSDGMINAMREARDVGLHVEIRSLGDPTFKPRRGISEL